MRCLQCSLVSASSHPPYSASLPTSTVTSTYLLPGAPYSHTHTCSRDTNQLRTFSWSACAKVWLSISLALALSLSRSLALSLCRSVALSLARSLACARARSLSRSHTLARGSTCLKVSHSQEYTRQGSKGCWMIRVEYTRQGFTLRDFV